MKVMVAMSGGVDSSVAAALLLEQGFDVTGVTLRLFDNADIGEDKEKTCCSLRDVEDARDVAFQLGIPYHVFNFNTLFRREVMDRFIAAYQSGATPNPCIDCNRYIKFDAMLRRAAELDLDALATGHYAIIEPSGGRYLLKKATDPTKDQSYVLYGMTQKQLAKTRFPLGTFSKTEVRLLAEKYGFSNAKKRDSQDICFVPDGDYARFIEETTGTSCPCGNFVDQTGHVLGKHRGHIRYTIGQRRGLGLALPQSLYVCSKDPETNTVVLGENTALFEKSLTAKDINLIALDSIPAPLRVKARVRYKQPEQWATVEQTAPGTLHIEFDEPQRAIARGQAVVLYDGDVVVGGGTIA